MMCGQCVKAKIRGYVCFRRIAESPTSLPVQLTLLLAPAVNPVQHSDASQAPSVAASTAEGRANVSMKQFQPELVLGQDANPTETTGIRPFQILFVCAPFYLDCQLTLCTLRSSATSFRGATGQEVFCVRYSVSTGNF